MVTSTQAFRVIPANEAPLEDVRTVFGTRGDPATCWCQYFKVDPPTWKQQNIAAFEAALCDQVREPGVGPGVLAYLDGTPVGWAAVEPRAAYRRIVRPDETDAADVDRSDAWAVTCFVVPVGFRRRGVAAALLDGAIAHARRHGARTLDGFPTSRDKKLSSADLYRGPRALFERAGFVPLVSSGSRIVMRLEL